MLSETLAPDTLQINSRRTGRNTLEHLPANLSKEGVKVAYGIKKLSSDCGLDWTS